MKLLSYTGLLEAISSQYNIFIANNDIQGLINFCILFDV